MSENELLLVYWRLEWAKEAVELLEYALRTLVLSGPALEEKALFEWVLIEAWDAHGAHKTQDELSALRLGFSSGESAGKGRNDA